ncbi:MAG: lysophospholipid acyltransferase family protein [Methylophilaceae bacterium]
MNPKPVQVWRLLRLFVHLLWGMLLATVWLPFLRAKHRDKLVRRWSKSILNILNVKLHVSGSVPLAGTSPAMFVSNHISWLDVWLVNSLISPRFVAKSEVRSWPLIGWLSEKGGVIFIERAKRKDTLRVSGAALQALADGDSLCVFPEGTTTDGSFMVPFRSSLLQAAVDAEVLLRPIALRYPLPNGGVNVGVAYWGDITLWESMLAMVKQPEIVAELVFLLPISTQGNDRRVLVRRAESAIAELLRLPVRAALVAPGGQLAGDLGAEP